MGKVRMWYYFNSGQRHWDSCAGSR